MSALLTLWGVRGGGNKEIDKTQTPYFQILTTQRDAMINIGTYPAKVVRK